MFLIFLFFNLFKFAQDYTFTLAVSGSTVEILNGTYDIASRNITSFVISFISTNILAPPTLIPTYSNGNNPWMTVSLCNVSFSGIYIYHTYNYSSWTGGLQNSAPLFLIESNANIYFVGVSFTSSNPSLLLTNPIFVGSNSDSLVDFVNSTFISINLERVSLIFDYWSTTFHFLNVTFRYVCVCFIL
jgi:hypothetical protein